MCALCVRSVAPCCKSAGRAKSAKERKRETARGKAHNSAPPRPARWPRGGSFSTQPVGRAHCRAPWPGGGGGTKRRPILAESRRSRLLQQGAGRTPSARTRSAADRLEPSGAWPLRTLSLRCQPRSRALRSGAAPPCFPPFRRARVPHPAARPVPPAAVRRRPARCTSRFGRQARLQWRPCPRVGATWRRRSRWNIAAAAAATAAAAGLPPGRRWRRASGRA